MTPAQADRIIAPAASRVRSVSASGVLRCWTARAGFDASLIQLAGASGPRPLFRRHRPPAGECVATFLAALDVTRR